MHVSSYFCHHIENINTSIFCNKQSINNDSLCINHQDDKDLIEINKQKNLELCVYKIKFLLSAIEKTYISYKKTKYVKKIFEHCLNNPIFLIDNIKFIKQIFKKLDELIEQEPIMSNTYKNTDFNPSDYLKKIKSKLNITDDIYDNIKIENDIKTEKRNDITIEYIQYEDIKLEDINGHNIIIEL